MKLAVANIKHTPLMRPSYARADIGKVAATGADVVFGTEIATYYRQIWRHEMAQRRLHTYGTVECPVSLHVDKHKVLSHRTRLLHRGLALVSPNRYFEEVLTRGPEDGKVACINTHLVSAAWGPRTWRPSHKWRRAKWELSWRIIRGRVAALHADGYDVVLGSDLNRRTGVDVHPNQDVIAHDGLTWLIAVPALGRVVEHHGISLIPVRELHTDHNVIVADFQFRDKKKKGNR